MAELPFPRRASGLTRRASFFDAFGVGFMAVGLIGGIIGVVGTGLAYYPGANLWLVATITLVVGCLTYPIIYGVLAGAMPRAGGQYVYNSRILHPAVAMAESFAVVFSWLFWTMILAPEFATIGLSRLAAYHDWQGLQRFVDSTWGLLVAASAVNVLSLLTVVFGLKVYSVLQKGALLVGVAATAVICAALTFTDRVAFASNWDMLARRYDSLSYDRFMAAATAAGGPFPTSWNWTDTLGCLVLGSWLVVYAYTGIYMAGEAKRPRRALGPAILLAIAVTIALLFWAVQGLYHVASIDQAAAFAWADTNGVDAIAGYHLPFSTDWMSLAYIARPSELVAWAGPVAYLVFWLWYVALMYLVVPRIWFAWGMDRLGPRWFTDISPRWASPIKNYLMVFALSQTLIVVYASLHARGHDVMETLMAASVDLVFAAIITATAALVFPWSRRARHIWPTAPLAGRRVLGLPVVTLAALGNLAYIGLISWYLFARPEMRDVSWRSTLMFCAVLAGSAVWYAFWRHRSSERGIDMHDAYRDLPPD